VRLGNYRFVHVHIFNNVVFNISSVRYYYNVPSTQLFMQNKGLTSYTFWKQRRKMSHWHSSTFYKNWKDVLVKTYTSTTFWGLEDQGRTMEKGKVGTWRIRRSTCSSVSRSQSIPMFLCSWSLDRDTLMVIGSWVQIGQNSAKSVWRRMMRSMPC